MGHFLCLCFKEKSSLFGYLIFHWHRRISDSLAGFHFCIGEEDADNSWWSTHLFLCLTSVDTYQIRNAISSFIFFSLDMQSAQWLFLFFLLFSASSFWPLSYQIYHHNNLYSLSVYELSGSGLSGSPGIVLRQPMEQVHSSRASLAQIRCEQHPWICVVLQPWHCYRLHFKDEMEKQRS